MAAMFVESFIDKLAHFEMYTQETAAKGIPFPAVALSLAAITEVLGSFALISGYFLRLGAVMLAGYVFTLGFIYFDFWDQQGMAAVMARKEFLKDFAVIAGLCLIALVGNNKKLL